MGYWVGFAVALDLLLDLVESSNEPWDFALLLGHYCMKDCLEAYKIKFVLQKMF